MDEDRGGFHDLNLLVFAQEQLGGIPPEWIMFPSVFLKTNGVLVNLSASFARQFLCSLALVGRSSLSSVSDRGGRGCRLGCKTGRTGPAV